MAPEDLSLQELADQTGLEPRTIRSYVERGILPGPQSMGRGARYPRESLDRLRVLNLIRDAKRDVSLDKIRLLLQQLSPGQIRDLAEGKVRIGALVDTDEPTSQPPERSAALEYLHRIGVSSPARQVAAPLFQSDAVNSPVWPADPGLSEEVSRLEQVATALAGLVGRTSSSRPVRGERWYRIPLTPDIELAVRGEFEAEQIAQLHRIGDALRVLLTRGVSK